MRDGGSSQGQTAHESGGDESSFHAAFLSSVHHEGWSRDACADAHWSQEPISFRGAGRPSISSSTRRRASSSPRVLASVHSLRSRRLSCSDKGGTDAFFWSSRASSGLEECQSDLSCISTSAPFSSADRVFRSFASVRKGIARVRFTDIDGTKPCVSVCRPFVTACNNRGLCLPEFLYRQILIV